MKRKASAGSKKQPAKAAPESAINAIAAAPKTSQWRNALLMLVGVGVCAAVGYYAATYFRTAPAGAADPVAAKPAEIKVVLGDGVNGPRGMVWVPGGNFLMGSDSKMAQPNEKPTHKVNVQGFWMDKHHVTNAEFTRFVKATGYVTTAERKLDWETIKVQVPPGTPKPPASALVPGAMIFVGTESKVPLNDYSQWWRFVPGANWRHPYGPKSNIKGKDEHPVVQVSYEDVQAYAKWAGKRLPTEAEWEFAARGGLEQATYAWGNELKPQGQEMANIWDVQKRDFPVVNPKAGGASGTLPVGTFPPNGYGLVDMTGNAWQWVADWYRSDYFQQQAALKEIRDPQGPSDSYDPYDHAVPTQAPRRVIRGGSFLCNEDYCLSYRPSARRGNDPYNPMSHIGFRLVMTEAQWQSSKSAVAARPVAAGQGS
jgi:formylglycine-generating enzyme required for sulfatase activity